MPDPEVYSHAPDAALSLSITRWRLSSQSAALNEPNESTARNHVSHILEKLGLTRRSQAAALAARLGLTPPTTQESAF